MSGDDLNEVQEELETLMQESTQHTDRIHSLGKRLGLSADELESASAGLAAEQPKEKLSGQYKITRRAGEILLFVVGIQLSAILIGFGAYFYAAGLCMVALVMFFALGQNKARHIVIGPAGELSFPGHRATLDWNKLASLDFSYLYPRGGGSLRRVAGEMMKLELHFQDNTSLRFAQGPLMQTSPRREPIRYYRLERVLKQQAKKAGLTVHAQKNGWIARHK